MTFTQGFGNSTPHHTSTTPLLTLSRCRDVVCGVYRSDQIQSHRYLRSPAIGFGVKR